MNSKKDKHALETGQSAADFETSNLSDLLVRFEDDFCGMLDVLDFFHTAIEAIIEVNEDNTDEQQHGMNITWRWIDSTGQTLKDNFKILRQRVREEELKKGKPQQ